MMETNRTLAEISKTLTEQAGTKLKYSGPHRNLTITITVACVILGLVLMLFFYCYRRQNRMINRAPRSEFIRLNRHDSLGF